MPIDSYRVDADGRLAVTVVSGGSLVWNRIAEMSETDDAVTVTIRTARAPLPMADIGIPAELIVPLSAPLGARVVMDGHLEQPITISR